MFCPSVSNTDTTALGQNQKGANNDETCQRQASSSLRINLSFTRCFNIK
jgi:hypothetical protein